MTTHTGDGSRVTAAEALAVLERAGLRVVLEQALARYRRGDGLNGRTRLGPEDAEALGRLTGRSSRRLDLAELDAALRASRYEVGLVPVLEHLNGGPIVVVSESRTAFESRWLALLERVEDHEWRATLERREAGAGRLRRALKDGTDLEGDLRVIGGAIAVLRHETPRLPVLAARVAGNAHGLDAGTLCGSVLEEATVALGLEPPTRDGVSSNVLVANLAGAAWLEALGGRSVFLPWREVVTLGRVVARTGRVLVVENPSVFEGLLEAGCRQALVCTFGQRRQACVELLDRCEAEFWLSCDFDLGGLRIFSSLLGRYPARVRPWHFDLGGYLAALERSGGVPLEHDIASFAPRFPELVGEMRARELGAHQEAVLPLLVEDAC